MNSDDKIIQNKATFCNKLPMGKIPLKVMVTEKVKLINTSWSSISLQEPEKSS